MSTRSRCPKNDIPAGRPCWRSRCQKLGTDRPFVQKLVVESGCRMSQRRDDFLLIALATGSAMAVRLSLPRKKAPNPIDQHVGSRLRMPPNACNEPGKAGCRTRPHLPAGAEIRERCQPHRGEPVAANVPYPSGASRVLLRGRAERTSATRVQWKRVIDGPD